AGFSAVTRLANEVLVVVEPVAAVVVAGAASSSCTTTPPTAPEPPTSSATAAAPVIQRAARRRGGRDGAGVAWKDPEPAPVSSAGAYQAGDGAPAAGPAAGSARSGLVFMTPTVPSSPETSLCVAWVFAGNDEAGRHPHGGAAP